MSPPTSRRPRAERRAQIARAALEIIGTRGLGELTTANLAAAIGVTSGALFRHFEGLEEILAEAVETAVTRVEATFPDEGLAPRERLRALALGRVRLMSREAGIAWLLRNNQAVLALPPEAVKRLQGLVRRSRGYIRRALREGVAAGEVRDDIGPDALLLVYTATVHALIGRPKGLSGRAPRARPAPAIQGLLTMLAPAASPNPRR